MSGAPSEPQKVLPFHRHVTQSLPLEKLPLCAQHQVPTELRTQRLGSIQGLVSLA